MSQLSQPQNQSFLPVMYLGGRMSFLYGPNSIQLDLGGTNVSIHSILGGKDQSEPVGIGLDKISLDGFFYSTDSTALTSLAGTAGKGSPGSVYNLAGANWMKNRPMGIGFYSQDNSTNSSSANFYSNVVYLQDPIHIEYRGGYGVYKYFIRLNAIEASPALQIQGTWYSYGAAQFNVPSYLQNLSGYFAAVLFQGTGMSTGGSAQYVTSVYVNGVNLAGAGQLLGMNGGIFVQNPQSVGTLIDITEALVWPLVDYNGYEGIYLNLATQNSITVYFNSGISNVSNVYMLFYPQ